VLPCLPVEGELTETDILSDQIIENTVRNSLRPLELARALAKLKALKGCNSQVLAKELGISGASITRAEALLSLSEDIQALVDSGKISESAGYEISRLPDADSQRELARSVAEGRVSRDGAADAVRAVVGKKHVKPKAARLPLRLDGGICVTVSTAKPLTWDDLLNAIDVIRKESRKLYEVGKDVTALARSLRAS
jgi:ParB family chromosome partitioning protein